MAVSSGLTVRYLFWDILYLNENVLRFCHEQKFARHFFKRIPDDFDVMRQQMNVIRKTFYTLNVAEVRKGDNSSIWTKIRSQLTSKLKCFLWTWRQFFSMFCFASYLLLLQNAMRGVQFKVENSSNYETSNFNSIKFSVHLKNNVEFKLLFYKVSSEYQVYYKNRLMKWELQECNCE